MSRQYYDDPYGSSRRHVTIQPRQTRDNSSRRYVPSTSSDFVVGSTFQPNRVRNYPPPRPPPPPPSHYDHEEYFPSNGYPNSTRSSSNRMNHSSNSQPRRQYRLETPSTHSYMPNPSSYHNNPQDLSRSTNRHYVQSPQSSSRHSVVPESYRVDQNSSRYPRNTDQYDRRHHREESYPSQSTPRHSHHRPVDVPPRRQHLIPVRNVDHSIHESSHSPIPILVHNPASILTHFLQGIFGGRSHRPAFVDDDNDDDDDNNSNINPIDLIAFAWMMQRPGIAMFPAAIHIQFGDLFDLLGQDEPPSVGLSESDIERIPTMTYRKSSKSKGNDDKCAICLSEYKTGETVKRLRCKHIFHPECIDPWLKTSTQCPICRGAQTD